MAELPFDLVWRGERRRTLYASDPAASRGRLHPEDEDPLRSPYQRDRDRIVHSNAFRRLKHKTQVFIHHEGDHFRTRLTHTLEVAQIARGIARPLGLDEDLAEALALAHDLGHPPFGHAGERALDRALADFEGFDHNAQSLRVVTALERRYPLFDGLNLTVETLEGLIKHNGPLLDPSGRPIGAHAGGPLPYAIREVQEAVDLELQLFPSLEAQAAAVADDIAYDCHDLEDGLRAGLVRLDELEDERLTAPILADVRGEYPGLESSRTVHTLVRRLISAMIHDVLAETLRGMEAAGIRTADEARRAGRPLARFSDEVGEAERGLKRFLRQKVYRDEKVMRPVKLAESIVSDLFDAFSVDPSLMPDDWGHFIDPQDTLAVARRVADYIAGMTDRYAIAEHRRLFDATPDLS
jgi:dGTPase